MQVEVCLCGYTDPGSTPGISTTLAPESLFKATQGLFFCVGEHAPNVFCPHQFEYTDLLPVPRRPGACVQPLTFEVPDRSIRKGLDIHCQYVRHSEAQCGVALGETCIPSPIHFA